MSFISARSMERKAPRKFFYSSPATTHSGLPPQFPSEFPLCWWASVSR